MEELKKLLGRKAMDSITGSAGTVTGVASYLTGEDQVCIEPEAGEGGEYKEGRWFDKGRISFSVHRKEINEDKYLEDRKQELDVMLKKRFGQKDGNEKCSCNESFQLPGMYSKIYKHPQEENRIENYPECQNARSAFITGNMGEIASFIRKRDTSVSEINLKIQLE